MNELEKKLYESFLKSLNKAVKKVTKADSSHGDRDLVTFLAGSLLSFTQAFATKVNAEKSIK